MQTSLSKSLILTSLNSDVINMLNHFLNKNYLCENDIYKDYSSASELIDALYENLVPKSGKADTVAGECIRAFVRIIYRYYNDGDLVGYGYGVETIAPSLDFIISEIPETRHIANELIKFEYNCKEYEDLLNYFIAYAFTVLITTRNKYFNFNNSIDSSEYWSDTLFNNYQERLDFLNEDDYEEDYEEDYNN